MTAKEMCLKNDKHEYRESNNYIKIYEDDYLLYEFDKRQKALFITPQYEETTGEWFSVIIEDDIKMIIKQIEELGWNK